MCMKNSKKSISIIGSGIWWLSSACYLAHQGHKVTVYEKNEQLGGRASVKKADWFTRDMGPSWYLMPDLFEQFFADFGKDIKEYLTLTRLDPSYKIYFKDNPKHPHIKVRTTLEDNTETFEALEPGSMASLKEYLKKSEVQYHIWMKEFALKNYDTIFDFFNWRMIRDGLRMNVHTTIGKYVAKFFSTDEMQKIIQYPMIFLWSPPYETPALYNLMSYVDFGMWVWYPQGGMWSLVQALVRLWKELWVEYHTDMEVSKIITKPLDKVPFWKKKKSQIQWIEFASWTCVATDMVVSNADMPRTETHLLEEKDQTYPSEYRAKHVLAPSGFIMYLGLDKKLEGLEHHTLVFNEDRSQNNAEIFKTKVFPTDPSFYICCPSKTDANVAPEGSENLFILVPFPSRIHMNDAEKQKYAYKVLKTTEKLLDQDITPHIVHQELFWPDEFSKRYHAYWWNALSWWAHLFKQTAIYRPNNISKKVDGLFYTWWYTNPGIGVPTCLISGKLVSERVKSLWN